MSHYEDLKFLLLIDFIVKRREPILHRAGWGRDLVRPIYSWQNVRDRLEELCSKLGA